MARLTAQQIAQMTPDINAFLASQGIGISGENDDGSPRYIRLGSDGERVSQGMVNDLFSGGELPDFQQESLRDQGILGLGGSAMQDTLNSEYFNQGGQRFSTPVDYFNYLYGGKGEQVGDYYVLPEGMRYDQYTNAPLRYEPPTPTSTQLMPYLIAALATYGASAAAGAGAAGASGAGGAAAAEAAPAFVGGASGAGIAGGAAGGGTLSGLTAAEMAALGAGGAGAAGGFTGGASGGGLAGEGAGLIGGASGGGVSGAVGGGLSGAAGAGLGAGALSGSGSLISRILDGTASASDWTSLMGSLGSAGLGMIGADAQGDAYSDVADKYLALGAPYRQKLEASYAPGFSMADQPDFMNALDIGAQAAARATSAKSGNPVDNPGAYSEMQKYISGSLALPQLNTYRSQLGSFGQLGTNTAGTNDTAAAGQVGGMYNAAGYGLGQLTQPKNPFEDAMKGLMGGFKLNQPGYL